jgi:hypothetical protein
MSKIDKNCNTHSVVINATTTGNSTILMPPPVSSVHLSSWDTCSCLDAMSCLTEKSGARQLVSTSKNGILVSTSISMVLLRSGGREYHQMNIIVEAIAIIYIGNVDDNLKCVFFFIVEACRDRCNMIVVDVDIIAERSETVVSLKSHTVVLKLMSSKLLIVMSGIFDRARQYDANGGINKKWCHFLTTAGQIRPLFSPANGQLFISHDD